MRTYSIKEIESLTGIKAHTLRMWEQRYYMVEPHRTETNIRFYDEEQLKMLLNVSFLLANGYRISRISQMATDEMRVAVKEAFLRVSDKRGDLAVQYRINDLILAMLEFDEGRFEQIYSSSVMKYGVERTLIDLISPFIERMQLMWRTGEMDSGQEHFMYYLIRQKVTVAIDGLPLAPAHAEKFLIFLPESEYRDLIISIYIYLLKVREKRIINLGQDISFGYLERISQTIRPDVLMTFLVAPIGFPEAQQYVTDLGRNFPDKTIFLAGSVEFMGELECPDNVSPVFSPAAFIDQLKTRPKIGESGSVLS